MKNKFVCLIVALIILSLTVVSAHQPRIVLDQTASEQLPIIVSAPEISQAFYGQFNEGPQYYSISSEKDFDLYLNVLVPDIRSAAAEVSFEVYKGNELIIAKDGIDFAWSKFYEEFGGDDYWKGPELRQQMSAGSYLIKVFSSDGNGKYVFAVGETESFAPFDMLKTICSLPALKRDFFEKSPLTAYFNKTGEYMLIFLISAAAVVMAVVWAVKKTCRKKKRR